MIFYDEDALFGSGEYEVLTVPEVLEFLNKKESRQFQKLCDLSEKRRKKRSIFTRGYFEARRLTNFYEGNKHNYSRGYSDDSYDSNYDLLDMDDFF